VKRFDFALERVLRLKRQRERLAEMALARARADLDAARGRVADFAGQLDRLARAVGESVGRAVPPERWVADAGLSARLGQALREAERQAEQAQRRLDEAARERVRRAVEAEALQTLRQEQWEQYRRELNRHEQERLDELSLGRWRPGDAPGTPPASDARP
jgi:flagellar FliJ protein